MSQGMFSGPDDGASGRLNGSPIPANVSAASDAAISAAAVDRAFESRIEQLYFAAEIEAPADSVVAISALRARHNDPAIARDLAHLMMTAPCLKVREYTRLALEGSEVTGIQRLLEADHMIKKLSERDCELGVGPESIDAIVAALKAVREHPLVASRLVETVLSGDHGAHWAATILQGTSSESSLKPLRRALSSALDRGFEGGAQRRRLSEVPTALKFATDPNTQALIIRAFKDGSEAFDTNNLRNRAARALAGIDTQEVRDLLIENVMTPGHDWFVRSGVARAIRELGSEEIVDELVPLIEGSLSQTAWIVAGEDAKGVWGRAITWFNLMLSREEELYDIRVQVALCLQDQRPDLAKKVCTEVIRDKSVEFPYRCNLFAGVEALNALRRL